MQPSSRPEEILSIGIQNGRWVATAPNGTEYAFVGTNPLQQTQSVQRLGEAMQNGTLQASVPQIFQIPTGSNAEAVFQNLFSTSNTLVFDGQTIYDTTLPALAMANNDQEFREAGSAISEGAAQATATNISSARRDAIKETGRREPQKASPQINTEDESDGSSQASASDAGSQASTTNGGSQGDAYSALLHEIDPDQEGLTQSADSNQSQLQAQDQDPDGDSGSEHTEDEHVE